MKSIESTAIVSGAHVIGFLHNGMCFQSHILSTVSVVLEVYFRYFIQVKIPQAVRNVNYAAGRNIGSVGDNKGRGVSDVDTSRPIRSFL
jgi:hypothetical protein